MLTEVLFLVRRNKTHSISIEQEKMLVRHVPVVSGSLYRYQDDGYEENGQHK